MMGGQPCIRRFWTLEMPLADAKKLCHVCFESDVIRLEKLACMKEWFKM